jgi:transposase
VTFFAFLKGLRRSSIRTGRRVVVITDNARYHHARLHKEWRASHVEDVLDYLPPYSPELNPIERVWKLKSEKPVGEGMLLMKHLEHFTHTLGSTPWGRSSLP